MKIGFDAKRVFNNSGGLGNYGRNTIDLLHQFNTDLNMVLYTPGFSTQPNLYAESNRIQVVRSACKCRIAKSWWRVNKVAALAKSDNIDVFHGLTNELPLRLNKYNIPSVVSIHDLIFLHYPELYNSIDRRIYHAKSMAACKYASKIIAVSKQTKDDIIKFYNIRPEKISIIYQNCHPRFLTELADNEKQLVLQKHRLPNNFLLFVGTLEERKNVLNILKAIQRKAIDIPIVLVGKATAYVNTLIGFAEKHQLEGKLFIRHQIPDEDLPAIYQSASLFVYPSLFEGFGIPVLEAISSGVPVITSNISSLPEAAGSGSLLTDPVSVGLLAEAIESVINNDSLRRQMIATGKEHAKNFSAQLISRQLTQLYQSLL